MDDQTLDSLKAALAASPGNVALMAVVLKELVERDQADAARELLDGTEVGPLAEPSQRLAVATVYAHTGAPDEALSVLTDATGEELLLRARILVRQGQQQDAARAYAAALGKNPTLEDLDLRAAIGAKVREVASGGASRLRVISNDDTDRSELTRLLQPAAEAIDFSAVGGLDSVKKEIERRIILPFKKPSIFQRFKKRVGGGILLYGPPGCGKTMLARATAGECKAQFFNVAISDVLDMYIGESERKLHALFEKARTSAPAVLFFDELEALAGRREYTREQTSSKLVSQFLSEMDGFAQNNQGVLILGATNVPWAVDAAFRRAGRFDRVLFVPPPDREARLAILKSLLAERPAERDLSLEDIARRTSGFSGADLRNLIETASDEAIEHSLRDGREVPIGRDHLTAALENIRPTTSEWLSTARNYARYANESGQYDDVLAFLKKYGK